MCDGSFSLGIKLVLSDLSADGIIISTTGHNTSIVGTSLFLKGSNLFASVRTVSRIWEVSAPASGLSSVDELVYVDLFWNYNGEMSLNFKGLSHRARYTVAAHMPLADDQAKNVMKFGGVDLSTNWISVKILPYSYSLYRKYQHAGIFKIKCGDTQSVQCAETRKLTSGGGIMESTFTFEMVKGAWTFVVFIPF